MAPVLIALERWDPDGGGRERYAAQLSAWLMAQGISVTIACAVATCQADRSIDACGTVAGVHEFVSRWRAQHPSGVALAMIPIACATHVQMHSGLTSLARAAEKLGLGRGVRGMFVDFGTAVNAARRKYDQEEADVMAPAGPALMVFSTRDADCAIRLHGVAAGRITIDRPGINRATFQPSVGQPERSGIAALFAGHNPRLKGLAPAIAALAAANRSGARARLTVAGRGSRRHAAWHALRTGTSAMVRATGALPQHRLVSLLQQSDVLIHPAHYDPFPRVVLEAMACGCVPIVTRTCGVAEILTHGVDGFVVESPAAVDAMTAAIVAAADAGTLLRMRAAAVARAATFDFDAHAASVLSWLRQPLAACA